jgi:hypothetical protein
MVLHNAGFTQDKNHAKIAEALRPHDHAAARLAMLNETRSILLERLMLEYGANWEIGSINNQFSI